jgi:carboxyl-terminal processing protease
MALLMGAAGAAQQEQLPMQDLRAFAEIFGRIKQDYVEPVDDHDLLEYAIRGMLSGLDPHSSYLNEEEFRELQVGTSGEFGGLGIEVGMEDGFVKVIAPIDDTPAQRAGIQAGDVIVRLDDRPVKGMSLDDAVKIMRGKRGTEITLTIVRDGVDKPLSFTVVRDVIKVASVKSRILEDGFGYVRISHFQARSTEDMLKAISNLKRQAQGRLKGLVLDLRNNPGGVLNGAVAVSDAFLASGIIVYTMGRDEDSRLNFTAAPDDVLEGAPIVVLVNGGSASASEIVAGALQDHKRAVIMGSQTFGKGSVQTIVPVNQHAAVKLTTARYFTPSGRSIQAEGIKPDILLSDVKVTALEKPEVERLKESDLSRHLENGNGEPAENGNSDGQDDAAASLAETDYQLNEALNLLKGLDILRSRG